jgi:hypothetical protein
MGRAYFFTHSDTLMSLLGFKIRTGLPSLLGAFSS